MCPLRRPVYDPCTTMFFYRYVSLISFLTCPDADRALIVLISNKHIMVDLSTGNNNKMYVPARLLILLLHDR